VKHLSKEQLEGALPELRLSPRNNGILNHIVCRPATGQREVLVEGELDLAEGLVGDNWSMRGANTPDGMPDSEMQLNIMNSRVTALITQDPDRWKLCGDQLYIDMDLSSNNLPAGTRLSIGSTIIEVTPAPHTGCEKFVIRFGLDAMRFVNSRVGKELNLRGINAKVVKPGTVRVGDIVRKI